jgi:hypothetical protein
LICAIFTPRPPAVAIYERLHSTDEKKNTEAHWVETKQQISKRRNRFPAFTMIENHDRKVVDVLTESVIVGCEWKRK